MSLVSKANKIINSRSEEKERQYGPMTEGMKAATRISELLNSAVKEKNELSSFKYLYGLKLSREKYNHKEDNLLDAIAYRIAEINALLQSQGSLPLTENEFTEFYSEHTKDMLINNIYEHTLISNELTTLNLKISDMYKIYLAFEISNEIDSIKNNNLFGILSSIAKQIYILNKLNEYEENKNYEENS